MLPGDLLIIGIILGVLISYYLFKKGQSYLAKKRVLKAGRAEIAARRFLESEGYTVLAVQERVPIITKVNGKPHKSHIKADLIVQKGKEIFVVDVKTGEVAQKPASPDNRRQLLEYFLVYRPNGVLVLDMDNKKLYRLEFEIDFPSPKGMNIIPYILSFCAGALLTYLLFKGGSIR
ncbi:hypothetical protein Dred_1080 [Desulforamulus reducens MI-1]|uniref:PD-(D/E)XK endonuclease-like domain-containing protein n=1 Tax=Desulforamulus reducens (strain ATCC BAA-1160 / DSM 100696 / MI-1) TaxID=349161 RepID=A4J3G2_DESRM|nr:hypothetical protein [Desulforamulus reducens]ABO49615.1 hypothetical protein Dred_1080 [Desulforamulus reducens MI-1]